ncbi:MAG: glycosyl hydrolase [Flavitalea sp.]
MKSRSVIFLLFSFLTSNALFAQLNWPVVNNTMKPWTRWWWQGSAVNKADLAKNLGAYQRAGIGGVELTPIYGAMGHEKEFLPFLSKGWMEMLGYTLKQSKQLGLGVDLANGTGWPFGGPWIADKDASHSIYYKTYNLSAGESLKEKIILHQEGFVRTANGKSLDLKDVKKPLLANKDQQSISIDQIQYSEDLYPIMIMAYPENGLAENISSKIDSNGKLNWRNRNKSTTIIALFTGLHGKIVERAAPGGEGYAIDHFSPTATKNYLKHFDNAFRGYDVSGIRSFFNDSYEVDDARGQSNWTASFLSEFKTRKKYKLEDHLPALFGLDSPEKNSQVLYDYRAVIDELLLEHFTINWKKWATARGAMVRNQSHGSPANTLDLYSVVDIPETEGNDILRFKFASSAGNVSGKKLVSAEAATWLNEHFLSDWKDVRKAVDLFFLGGVNHIFYHGTAYSPADAPWPGWLFYAAVHFQPTNPMWKHFDVLNKYITRTQSFLQTSKPDNDILVYYPIADQYAKTGKAMLQHFDGMEHNFEETDFKKLSEWMLENDYQFDFFSSRQLQRFSYDKGIVSSGNKYQVILLPGNKYLEAADLGKLVALARQGATIAVYKDVANEVPGFADRTNRQSKLDSLKKLLRFSVDGLTSRAPVGRGFFIVSEDAGALLRACKVRKETLHENKLSFVRKKNQQGTLYFISNNGENEFNGWINLSAVTERACVAAFNPMNGEKGMLSTRLGEDNQHETYLKLQPGESMLLQVSARAITADPFSTYDKQAAPTILSGKWQLEFLEGGPSLPQSRTIESLVPWNALNDTAANNFSGLAKYSLNFERPVFANKDVQSGLYWELTLDKVYHTAEVFLNGRSLGASIGPAYKWRIKNSDLALSNKLEIEVANLMANRIAYMDRNNLPWKIFYNTNMPARKKENSKNGLFDASQWKPLPSGLSGSATLTPLITTRSSQ